jgi:hypothetical protein
VDLTVDNRKDEMMKNEVPPTQQRGSDQVNSSRIVTHAIYRPLTAAHDAFRHHQLSLLISLPAFEFSQRFSWMLASLAVEKCDA